MRVLRHFPSVVWTGFCLVGVLWAFGQGKLLVRANVAGADVYLQDTPVAKTDARHRLLIEQIPEGTYTVSVRRAGYADFRGVIRVTPGRTTTLHVTLHPEKTERMDRAAAEPGPSPATESEAARKPARHAARAEKTARAAAEAEPTSAHEAGHPATREWPAPPTASKPTLIQSIPWREFGWIMAVGLGLSWAVWRLARAAPVPRGMPASPEPDSPQPAAEGPEPRPPDAGHPREDPRATGSHTAATQPTEAPERRSAPHGFMRDLRRKEELLEAGLISEPPRRENRRVRDKASETVIEVSKDEYRYEENSDG